MQAEKFNLVVEMNHCCANNSTFKDANPGTFQVSFFVLCCVLCQVPLKQSLQISPKSHSQEGAAHLSIEPKHSK